MEIVDLSEKYHLPYFCCLEEWSEEMKEAGSHKAEWYHFMKDKGIIVKLAVENGNVLGMIQCTPSEYAIIRGEGLYFINCIWVHGYKQGVGNQQKRGIGKALLKAIESETKIRGSKGIVAWGLMLPIWMKASWYKKLGYKKVDRNGIAQLLWKPFSSDATPPKWITKRKKPEIHANEVTVTSFINGWCPAFNIVHERAKRAVLEIGPPAVFREISTRNIEALEEWGIADALYINQKEVNCGPPPKFEKIKNLIQKQVNKLSKEYRKTPPL